MERLRLGPNYGKEPCSFTRAHISRRLAHDHGDIGHVTQTQVRAVQPKGSSAIGGWEASNPGAPVVLERQMRNQVLDRLVFGRFLRMCDGEESLTSSSQIVGIALDHHLAIQLIFCWILEMAFGLNRAKRDKQPKDVTTHDQKGKANTEKLEIIFAFASCLSQ